MGEIPDPSGATQFYSRLSKKLIEPGDITLFIELCEQAGKMPVLDTQKFNLLGGIAEIAQIGALPLTAVLCGLEGDWSARYGSCGSLHSTQ